MTHDLPPLPLPALEETLTRTCDWLAPVADEKTREHSRDALARFASGEGIALQSELQRTDPDSGLPYWNADVIAEQRLRDHRSLPLAGNIALAIDWHAAQRGLKRVAHFINAMLHVHVEYLNGQLPQAHNADGQPLCMAQWDILRGVSRRPHLPRDQYRSADAARHIVVIHEGCGWKIRVLDDRLRIANPAQIEKALCAIAESGDSNLEIPFGAPSILAAQNALEVRAQLISRDDNRRIWDIVEDALFVVSLDARRYNDSTDGLHDALFGGAPELWAYKPLNYCCHYRDDRLYLHAETSRTNTATLQAIVQRAQYHHDNTPYQCKNALPAHLDRIPLAWTIEHNTEERLRDGLAQYRQQAEKMALTAVDIFLTDEDRKTLRNLPGDAIIQLLLQYAQHEVYGLVRSIREAVDMRHFRHGRLDIMRPVTDASLAAAAAMHDGTLSHHHLEDSIAAHGQRLAHCREGRGIHYHLLALQEAGRRLENPSALFRDEGLRLLNEDFLHTATLGAHNGIASMAFAPRHPQGMSIHYAFNRNNINIMITHRRTDLLQIKTLGQALRAGVRQIVSVLGE
ncbi:MAG: choline/carnitine O-acyltransferase [Cardiobacteriaceae bacterium]|nr:choline/carnitine O-acyltransferase [Cardiobacteriaceae bacterium]